MDESQTHISGLTIEELSERVGVPTRTIRFYIAEGLLPGPGTRGKAAAYGEDHLVRLRLIRRLVERHVPLAEQRELLDRLSPEEMRDLLAKEDAGADALERAAQAESPRDYVAGLLARARSARSASATPYQPAKPSLPAPSSPRPDVYEAPRLLRPPGAPAGEGWRRWDLAPGVELHVREDALRRYRVLIERLLRQAREPSEDHPRS